MDNANIGEIPNKSPAIDRNVIEEFNNLDRVAMRNLRDWDKRVAGSSVNNAGEPSEGDREWSPDPNDAVEAVAPVQAVQALSYDDISGERPEMSEGEVTDSDIETAGSEADRPALTDSDFSDVAEVEAEYQIAGDADLEKQCWVCFASEEDDPLAAWVHPCLCKGTTKWVHQVCIQRWVDEKQKGNSSANVACPQCGADYMIQFPESPALLRLLDTLDKLVGRLCPVIAGGVCVGSLYWTCVTYGAITVMQVTGHDKGLSIMERADPLLLLVSLPLVPVGLVLGKMVRWQDPVLRFLRTRLPRMPLTRFILPAFASDPDNEGSSSAANLPPASDPVSMTRTFCGALFFPTVAVFLGNALFEHEKAPLKRACMGGFCFVGAKGVLKIYHKQHQYIRQSKRLILDYDQ